jgi:predicted transcriptional regulator
MSKRLQVLLDERELKALQRIARRKGTTAAEWVRQALRAAARHEFPTADIDDMLADISRGASAGTP